MAQRWLLWVEGVRVHPVGQEKRRAPLRAGNAAVEQHHAVRGGTPAAQQSALRRGQKGAVGQLPAAGSAQGEVLGAPQQLFLRHSIFPSFARTRWLPAALRRRTAVICSITQSISLPNSRRARAADAAAEGGEPDEIVARDHADAVVFADIVQQPLDIEVGALVFLRVDDADAALRALFARDCRARHSRRTRARRRFP